MSHNKADSFFFFSSPLMKFNSIVNSICTWPSWIFLFCFFVFFFYTQVVYKFKYVFLLFSFLLKRGIWQVAWKFTWLQGAHLKWCLKCFGFKLRTLALLAEVTGQVFLEIKRQTRNIFGNLCVFNWISWKLVGNPNIFIQYWGKRKSVSLRDSLYTS